MFLFKLKCMECGLHFMVCSWNENWPTDDAVDDPVFCPECGQHKGRFMVWVDERPHEQIFEHVPGTSRMVSFGLETP